MCMYNNKIYIYIPSTHAENLVSSTGRRDYRKPRLGNFPNVKKKRKWKETDVPLCQKKKRNFAGKKAVKMESYVQ